LASKEAREEGAGARQRHFAIRKAGSFARGGRGSVPGVLLRGDHFGTKTDLNLSGGGLTKKLAKVMLRERWPDRNLRLGRTLPPKGVNRQARDPLKRGRRQGRLDGETSKRSDGIGPRFYSRPERAESGSFESWLRGRAMSGKTKAISGELAKSSTADQGMSQP